MRHPPHSKPPLPASSPDLIRGPIYTHSGIAGLPGRKAAASPFNQIIGSDAAMGPRIKSGDDAVWKRVPGCDLQDQGEPA